MCTRKNPGSPIIYAENDRHALALCRRVVANLNTKKSIDIPLATPVEPKYDLNELDGIVPVDLKKQFDVREVIARLVDGSSSTSSRRSTARRS